MANVNVSYAEIESAAAKLNKMKGELDAQLTSLKSFVGQLVASGFVTDKASVQFDATVGEFTKSALDLMRSVDNMSTYLRNAAQALQSLDQELANRAK